jgi:uncharacterized protein
VPKMKERMTCIQVHVVLSFLYSFNCISATWFFSRLVSYQNVGRRALVLVSWLAAEDKDAKMKVLIKIGVQGLKKILFYFRTSVLPFLAAYTIIIVVSNLLYSIYQLMISVYIVVNQRIEAASEKERLFGELETMMSRNMIYLIMVASLLICGIVFGFWYHRETYGQPRVNLRSVFCRRNMIYFVIMGIGCQFFFSGVMNLIQPLFHELFEDYGETMEGLLGSNPFLVLLYTIVIAPISEELIFRGVTLYRSRRVLPFVGANLLQAIFFGIYHRNLIQGIYAFAMGLLLGLVYRRYRTILAPILLHMLVNASVFLLALFPPSTISYAIMMLLGLIGGGFAFFKLKLTFFLQFDA